MATRKRPPEDPASRARAISTQLIKGLRGRVIGGDSQIASEFLTEGVATGDVEDALQRLANNLIVWGRERGTNADFPCLLDEEGPVPVDVIDFFTTVMPLATGYLYSPIFWPRYDFEGAVSSYWGTTTRVVSLGGLEELLSVVESRLTRFLQTRIQTEGGSEPTKVKSGNDSGGGGGDVSVGRGAAVQTYLEETESDNDTQSENELEVSPQTATAQIRTRQRLRSLGAAVAGFTGTPTLYQATIHSMESGLRIHQSPAYFINWSLVFGSPTPSVTGWLLPGRYKFGAMSPAGKFRFDNSNFDIPPLSSFDLVLQQ